MDRTGRVSCVERDGGTFFTESCSDPRLGMGDMDEIGEHRRERHINLQRPCNEEGVLARKGGTGRDDSDLSSLFLHPIENCLECRFAEPTFHPRRLVAVESRAEPLRAIVECIAEGLVEALKIGACHEDLHDSLLFSHRMERVKIYRRTLSKAVEHARGWVATKMGLLDIFAMALMIEVNGAGVRTYKNQCKIVWLLKEVLNPLDSTDGIYNPSCRSKHGVMFELWQKPLILEAGASTYY